MNIDKLVIIYLHGVILQTAKSDQDKRVKNSTQQDDTNRGTKHPQKQRIISG